MRVDPVSGVLLAAGPSSRLGGPLPKQLLEVDGEPLVRRVARRALSSGLSELLVVVGHAEERVREALLGLPVTAIQNPDWERGQSGSVRTGLAAVRPTAGAALFLTADQPHLTGGVIDLLIGAWRSSDAAIVVPAFAGRRGSPVLLDRRLFSELERLGGDEGARQLFPRHAADLLEVQLEDERPLLDVDTDDDRRLLLGD